MRVGLAVEEVDDLGLVGAVFEVTDRVDDTCRLAAANVGLEEWHREILAFGVVVGSSLV